MSIKRVNALPLGGRPSAAPWMGLLSAMLSNEPCRLIECSARKAAFIVFGPRFLPFTHSGENQSPISSICYVHVQAAVDRRFDSSPHASARGRVRRSSLMRRANWISLILVHPLDRQAASVRTPIPFGIHALLCHLDAIGIRLTDPPIHLPTCSVGHDASYTSISFWQP
ncbi:hypothetical protein Enr13x_11700 [Stieleria neptunia]|uniref:Uncharacterized protein n=1 Tax=Stieleria neptunia TaxID=2527979 RepID=A0A518HKE6_9BACT|nr:hypothetical protein Enr13x_11700 [Stieleria neptunia]